MSQCHLRTVKMEEIHQFDRPSLPQRSVVYPSWFIIQFQYDWIDLCSFCDTPMSYEVKVALKTTKKAYEGMLRFWAQAPKGYWDFGR